jgi:hypothetical protein
MKTKPQKTIALEEIKKALTECNVLEARLRLSDKVGASLTVRGRVEKVARREDKLKLLVEAFGLPSRIMVIADFNDEAEKTHVREAKIRKSSTVSVQGKLTSFGALAVCLSDCRLNNFGVDSGKLKTLPLASDATPCKQNMFTPRGKRKSSPLASNITPCK